MKAMGLWKRAEHLFISLYVWNMEYDVVQKPLLGLKQSFYENNLQKAKQNVNP